METGYLCSRTEFFRMVDLDVGVIPLIIGAPSSFLEWISKILPGGSVTVDQFSNIPEGSYFDRIVIWAHQGDGIKVEEVQTVKNCMHEHTSLWIIRPMIEENEIKNDLLKTDGDPLPISTDLILQKILFIPRDQ